MKASWLLMLAALALVGGCSSLKFNEVASLPATSQQGLKTLTMTSPQQIGNYDVTLTFGDPFKPTVNWVKFEGRRVALMAIETGPGEMKSETFTARVKGPVARDDDTTGESPYPSSLNVTVVTSADRVLPPEVERNDAARVIYLCGDATVADAQAEPWGGWGQCLPLFFRPGTAVANFAGPGQTVQSFLQHRRLDRVLARLKVGDLVLLQFGRNDLKTPSLAPYGGFQEKLNACLDKIHSRGARAMLITPLEPCEAGVRGPQRGRMLADYVQAMREVAEQRGVDLIDLNGASARLYETVGANAARSLFAVASTETLRRDFPDDPAVRGLHDTSHTSMYGAYVFAHYIADELVKRCPEFKKSRRAGFEAASLARLEPDPAIPPSGRFDATCPECYD